MGKEEWSTGRLIVILYSLADKILKTLGEGTFGRVVKVKDMDK